MTNTQTWPVFSAEVWAAFWAAPDMSLATRVLDDDIVGYWRFDSETWDRKFEAVSDEMLAVYDQALADGMGNKLAAEEFDIALERVGL